MRGIVENAFGNIQRYPVLLNNYEKKNSSYRGLLMFVLCRMLCKRINKIVRQKKEKEITEKKEKEMRDEKKRKIEREKERRKEKQQKEKEKVKLRKENTKKREEETKKIKEKIKGIIFGDENNKKKIMNLYNVYKMRRENRNKE